MEELKGRIFSVLANVSSKEIFTEWLYTDANVIQSLDEDSFVFEVVNINYKTNDALYLLEKIALKRWSLDEFFLYVIEYNFQKLAEFNELTPFSKLTDIVRYVGSFYSWDNSSELICTFSSLEDDIDLVRGDYFMSCVINYAKYTLKAIENCSLEEKIEFMDNEVHAYYNFYRIGEGNNPIYPKEENKEFVLGTENMKVANNLPQKKKWYEFWKL